MPPATHTSSLGHGPLLSTRLRLSRQETRQESWMTRHIVKVAYKIVGTNGMHNKTTIAKQKRKPYKIPFRKHTHIRNKHRERIRVRAML